MVGSPLVEIAGQGYELSCTHNVDNLKKGPEDWTAIVGTGNKCTDYSFWRKEQDFKLPFNGWGDALSFFFGRLTFTFDRLSESYPDATLFGSDDTPKFDDV